MTRVKLKKPKYEIGQEVQIFLEGAAHKATITGLNAWNWPYNGDVEYYCNTDAPYPNSLLLLREDLVYPLGVDLAETEVLFNEIQSLRHLCITLETMIEQEQEKIDSLKKRKDATLKKIRILGKQMATIDKALRKEHK